MSTREYDVAHESLTAVEIVSCFFAAPSRTGLVRSSTVTMGVNTTFIQTAVRTSSRPLCSLLSTSRLSLPCTRM